MSRGPPTPFEGIFERSLDAILLARPDGSVVRANAAACRALGRSEAELVAVGRKAVLVEDAKAKAFLRERETKGEGQAELTLRRASGECFTAQVSSGALPDGLVYVIFRDVTAQRSDEKRLRRSNRALKLVSRCNEALVRAESERALYDDVCRGIVEAGGYAMCWVGLAQEDGAKAVVPVASYGDTGRYLDGIRVEWSDSPLGQGPTGTAVRTGAVSICRDFAEDPLLGPWKERALKNGFRCSTSLPLWVGGTRLGAVTMYSREPETFDEEELQLLSRLAANLSMGVRSLRERAALGLTAQERDWLSRAVAQAHDFVLLTDPGFVISYVNPALEAVTGYSKQDVVGQPTRLLRFDGEPGDTSDGIRAALERGTSWSGRLLVRRKDGHPIPTEANFTPVRDAGGTVTHHVGVLRDLTRSLALEAQLVQAQKMESVGRLAGGIAHDFNNILSVILSLTDVSLRAAALDPALRQDLEMISEAGQRAARLTHQLLAFSRKQVLQPVPLDLAEVVRGVKDLLRRLLGEDIVLRVELEPPVGELCADPGQLEQVLLNLAVNARDAMPHGGTLTIGARRARLEGDALAKFGLPSPGEYVLLTVSDTGTGMDAATRAHIFEPFFTTKIPGAGTGLGLATVYGIVTQSGGAISVSSVLGSGTTFELAFPASTDPCRPKAPCAPPRPGRASGASVLVVEDDELVRTVACRILEQAGYSVRAVTGPEQALALTRDELAATHLVLSDVIMPGLSGPALVERLRARRPGLPALFMSGYPDDKLGQHGVLEPSVKLVAKPLTPDKLLRRVADALAGRDAGP